MEVDVATVSINKTEHMGPMWLSDWTWVPIAIAILVPAALLLMVELSTMTAQ